MSEYGYQVARMPLVDISRDKQELVNLDARCGDLIVRLRVVGGELSSGRIVKHKTAGQRATESYVIPLDDWQELEALYHTLDVVLCDTKALREGER